MPFVKSSSRKHIQTSASRKKIYICANHVLEYTMTTHFKRNRMASSMLRENKKKECEREKTGAARHADGFDEFPHQRFVTRYGGSLFYT